VRAGDGIATVTADKPGDPFDRGARPPKLVVAGKDRRIVGSQA
jgi:hypothetical protein